MMMRITETLVAEHAVFRSLFDFIELMLAESPTLREVKLLGSLVGALLHGHGEAEEHLVLAALDHTLAEHGGLDRLHHEHHEIDGRLKRLESLNQLSEARRLLEAVVLASRKHFEHEERVVFPLVEKVLPPEMLTELNNAWSQRRRALAVPLPSPVALAGASSHRGG
jgi:hemerythrin-like domain-containing protein